MYLHAKHYQNILSGLKVLAILQTDYGRTDGLDDFTKGRAMSYSKV